MSATDTEPDGPVLLDNDAEHPPARDDGVEQARARREAADALLQKFTKPRPPAPTPKQRAESNGDPFVAYSAVHSPAISANPHVTAPGIRVDERFAASMENETIELPAIEETTTILPILRARRYVLLGSSIALFVIVAVTLANLVLRSPTPHVDAAATMQPRPSETVAAPKLNIPRPPEPVTATAPPSLLPPPDSTSTPTSAPPSATSRALPQAARQGPSAPSLTTKIPEDP